MVDLVDMQLCEMAPGLVYYLDYLQFEMGTVHMNQMGSVQLIEKGGVQFLI